MDSPNIQKIIDTLSEALSVFDFSYLVSGIATFALLCYEFSEHNVISTLKVSNGWLFILVPVAIYICGMVSWSIGKLLREWIHIGKLNFHGYKRDAQEQLTSICEEFGNYALLQNCKSIEKGIELNNYVSFVWDELSKISLSDDSVKSQLKFIRREWVTQAVYEGLIFSSLLFGIIFGIEVNTGCIIWHIIIGVLVGLAFVILMFYKATESGRAYTRDLIITYLNHSQKPVTPKKLK